MITESFPGARSLMKRERGGDSSAYSLPPLRSPEMDRVGIGHALVDDCSLSKACEVIIAHAQRRGRPAFVTTANAQHIVLLDGDKYLRDIYNNADLVVADGISLILAARLHGRCLRERVAGVDMFQSLCARAAESDLHVFLLGGRPGSAERAAMVFQQRSPRLRISTYCPPVGFERTKDGLERTAEAVRSTSPDLLFVGLGAPKQEYWIYEHGLSLGVPMSIGVGGSFEMVSGVVSRAPRWVQGMGCEWLYRLCLEPRRMWRRYLIGNVSFATIVARQGLRRALLSALFSFLDKDAFGAEVREPRLQQHQKELVSRLFAVSAGDGPESRSSDVLGRV